jgi:hypothetical protein
MAMATRTAQLWSPARPATRACAPAYGPDAAPLSLQARVLTVAALSLASWLVTLGCIMGLWALFT